MSSAGSTVLAVAYLLPLAYLGWSFFRGRPAPRNPWQATGLEWQTASPPPEDNFERPPRVGQGPYHYHPEGSTNENENDPPEESQGEEKGDAP
jgi:cytochrome c oxidase subunit 1